MKMPEKSRRFWLLSGLILALLFSAAGFGLTRMLTEKQLNNFTERFMLVNSLRKDALASYFETVRAEITFWSLNGELLTRQTELTHYWDTIKKEGGNPGAKLQALYIKNNSHPDGQRNRLNDAGDGSPYSEIHAALHPLARRFVTERGYYDLFLISADGDIIYSVEKEADFGTNLISGAWHNTPLADVFTRALTTADKGKVVFSDFATYGPSNNAPAMFTARVMTDKAGKTLGVLALQLPTERIDSIMKFTAGMGETGETYLVGEDRLMRSDSRFSDSSTILSTHVDTTPVTQALSGKSGAMLTTDYRGEEVLSAFSSLSIGDNHWAVIAEIDKKEVLQTIAQRHPHIAGLMLLLYSLALWSFWYIRPGDWGEGGMLLSLDIDTDQQNTGSEG